MGLEGIAEKCDELGLLLSTSLHESDFKTVMKELSALSEKSSPTKGDARYNIPHSLLEVVGMVFEQIHFKISNSHDHPQDLLLQCIIECYRIFRNCCAGNLENQSFIANKTDIVNNTFGSFNSFLNASYESEYLDKCIQTSIQFLGNLVVNNTTNQLLVWEEYQNIIEDIFSDKNRFKSTVIANYACMVLHNIILGCPKVGFDMSPEIHRALIDLAVHDSEFALCVVQQLVESENYISEVYKGVKIDQRLFLLDTAHSVILSRQGGKMLPVSSVILLAHYFKEQSECILKTEGYYVDKLEPAETAKLLEVVASASGNSPYLEELQTDMSLLIDCCYLLDTMHTVGKASDNNFTAIQRLADLAATSSNTEALESHPAFNFKCGLVRLLGNLCWRHRVNQDQIRSLRCIPLLLDCCNMDARNPLIIQWVVMAVRNLCEGNEENQAVIAGMNRRGTVSSATLQEMGLTLSDDGENKICIARLERTEK